MQGNNRNTIIIVVVLLLLCCCCSFLALGWVYGDALLEMFNTL
jgi:hypothetical protein